mmetsp:Transcript_36465/g.102987  ORF Transcript_36465/g.102987 Transcript_36465/m.102987 type:complete len:200 (-) Transcript_36465:939-1538(-)
MRLWELLAHGGQGAAQPMRPCNTAAQKAKRTGRSTPGGDFAGVCCQHCWSPWWQWRAVKLVRWQLFQRWEATRRGLARACIWDRPALVETLQDISCGCEGTGTHSTHSRRLGRMNRCPPTRISFRMQHSMLLQQQESGTPASLPRTERRNSSNRHRHNCPEPPVDACTSRGAPPSSGPGSAAFTTPRACRWTGARWPSS